MTPEQSAARQQIELLIQRYKDLTPDERKAMTEAGVVRQFVDPLLKALGWPIEEPHRYKYKLYTEACDTIAIERKSYRMQDKS